MHAEYKVPDGKLVVIDTDLIEGRLRNVQVSGDFFLEPDSALARISAALEGMPHDAEASRIVSAVQSELEPGTAMFGITPAAIAEVVQRAVNTETDP